MSERDKVLDKILGVPGAAAKLKKGVREMKATLDQHGLQHKALKDKPRTKGIMEEAGGKLDEVKALLSEDPNLAQELLEFMMDLLGSHAEPDEDNAVAPEATEEEFEAVTEEPEGETEAKPEPEEEFDEDEKAQPGYGEMEPDTSQELVNQAITKKPGTFPKPVSRQVKTGKEKRGKRGKSVKEPEWLTAVKSLTQRLDDIEAAISELASLPERVEQLAPDTAFKAFAPRQASTDATTIESDPELLKKAKQLNTQYDPFWGGTVQPK